MYHRVLSIFLICALLLLSCSTKINSPNSAASNQDSSLNRPLNPSAHVSGISVLEGLEVSTMAKEPMLKNPTNIDVDDRGRIWVTEAYNYRPLRNGNPTTEKGDRIVILEDTDLDGVADTAKVFYQGAELNAPLGICVLGSRVIVSQSPYVWSFYDDNGDDKADRKEIMFQGIGGEQHDHGAHSFSFGPDGKLYFTFGNEGRTLRDKNGKTVLDQYGDEISPKKYKEGMLLRCNLDGTGVEVLGQNFRNAFEAAVDSYGTLWQSDNDDDGNRGARINYVMEHGNYGYKDEMTNASWQQKRTNMEDSIPLRHWHLNDPGVVPNLLQTFAGSPTGLVVYEGSLLPKPFRNQMIHAEPGHNVVRSYPVRKSGAGYTAEIVNILKASDQWFRPSDICVAPDGSLIIADWYDPGVGGHQAGDQTKGRIYRLAPPQSRYSVPAYNYSTAAGALQALQSPNLSVRYKAWMALHSMGKKAIPGLEKLWNSSSDPRMRARAFWVLVKTSGADTQRYFREAAQQSNPDLKIMALKAARQLDQNTILLVNQLVNDPDAAVRRECALTLFHNKSPEAPLLWAKLASAYNGNDRWYLESLGIGADGQWDQFFNTYVSGLKDPLVSSAFRDIAWRARTEQAVPFIAQLASEKNVPLAERLRYFRAFDFNSGPVKYFLLTKMIEDNINDMPLNKLALQHLDVRSVKNNNYAQSALINLLAKVKGTAEYLDLIRKFELQSENAGLLDMAISRSDNPEGREAADLLLKSGGVTLIWKVINENKQPGANALILSLSKLGSQEALNILETIIVSRTYPDAQRKYAASKLGLSGGGQDLVLALLKSSKAPQEITPELVAGVQGALRKSVAREALTYLPRTTPVSTKKEPVLAELEKLTSNPVNGKALFLSNCSVCHKVNNQGFDFGPDLSGIGTKYPKEALLETIVNPSKGISFGYESWEIQLKDGSTTSGIIQSRTESELELKFPGGAKHQIKAIDIKSTKELKISMMPEGLHQSMSSQQLADLLEYLKSLQKK